MPQKAPQSQESKEHTNGTARPASPVPKCQASMLALLDRAGNLHGGKAILKTAGPSEGSGITRECLILQADMPRSTFGNLIPSSAVLL